ncbi:MAG: deoxyguanosinetriphosphate triphosphohydrolase [Pseudomonadota bacterium]
MLKDYAATAETSRGRLYNASSAPGRDDFQRDRDRIVHSKAFRRLAHKTQVFVYYEGDHYRNRLTHSLEVAQITRAVARMLGVNEDLAETTALAHDLGHPPFGHAGEDALDAKMKDYGGFDHNAQSLRAVTYLEKRYPLHDGLNLTIESLEGILKHNGPIATKEENLPRAIKAFKDYKKLDLHLHAGIEAQIAAICDDIAYNAHDIDDGMRADMLNMTALMEIDFCGNIIRNIQKDYPDIASYPLKHEFIRRLITYFVQDMVQATTEKLNEIAPKSYDEVRHAGKTLVVFSEAGYKNNKELKGFLLQNMYKHFKVNRMTSKARRVISDLCDIYMSEPNILAPSLFEGSVSSSLQERAVIITDFIAGMTDKFALEEHRKLFDLTSDYL